MDLNFLETFQNATPMLLRGLLVTIEISVLSLTIALLLGLIACLMGMSKYKPVVWLSKLYIWVMRGTPIMVQAFFLYIGMAQFFRALGYDFRWSSAFMAGTITLCLNAGAYIAEIFRGGIQAIDSGQMEAARSLGLTKGKAMRKIILPQAFKICIPSLLNQFIITIKDTSIISTIGLAEVMYEGKIYIGMSMNSFATYGLIALMYLVIISILSAITNRVERKMNYGKKS